MATTITGYFATRREAELAVEHLVQDHGLARTDVFVEADSPANTAGTEAAGADVESGHPGESKSGAPKLAGRIKVSVDLNDDGTSDKVQSAFREAGGMDILRG